MGKTRNVVSILLGIALIAVAGFLIVNHYQQVIADRSNEARVTQKIAAVNQDYAKQQGTKDHAARLKALADLENDFDHYQQQDNQVSRVVKLYQRYIASGKKFFVDDDKKQLAEAAISKEDLKRADAASLQKRAQALDGLQHDIKAEETVVYSAAQVKKLTAQAAALHKGLHAQLLALGKQESAHKQADKEAAAQVAAANAAQKAADKAQQAAAAQTKAQAKKSKQSSSAAQGGKGSSTTSSSTTGSGTKGSGTAGSTASGSGYTSNYSNNYYSSQNYQHNYGSQGYQSTGKGTHQSSAGTGATSSQSSGSNSNRYYGSTDKNDTTYYDYDDTGNGTSADGY